MSGYWETKSVRSVFLDKYFVRLEKMAFGWTYTLEQTEVYGTQSEISITDNGIYETRTPLSEKYMYFVRPKGYTNNLFFKLFELLDGIFGFLRRIGMALLLPVVILMATVFVLSHTVCTETGSLETVINMLPAVGILYAVIIIPPLVFALFGFIIRKIKKLD